MLPTLYINPSNSNLERYRAIAPGASSSSYAYQLIGADRTVNPSAIANGMLERINYLNGGSTTLVYEPNDFYDGTAQAVIQGGGVRVKQITDYDGINISRNQVTNYTYLNPSTGQSSGSIVTMPAYAFTTPYTGTGTTEAKWAASTVRSETDLSATDNNVLYGYVRVSSPGTGNVLYQYSTPAMNWDLSASPDWQPTMAYSARIGCGTATYASNEKRAYPFAPDINYGFERGLPLSTIAYNEGGQKVTETTYNYNRSFSTPVIITGLKFEDNSTLAKNYIKYSIFTTTSELPVQTTTKSYDLNDETRFQTNTVSYNYNGTNHKLPTSTQTTRSDGSVRTTNIKYVKDYSPAASSDSIANALYVLQLGNQNLPVESYTQVTRAGVTKTISAQLTKFNRSGNWIIDGILPVQSLTLISPIGITNFQPSVISSGVFSHDSRYIVQQNNVSFNLSGAPLTYNNNRKQVFTNIEDENTVNPAARVAGAGADEVGFTDFDYISTVGPAFNTDTAKIIGGHSGTYSKDLTGKTLTRTLKKSSQATSYIFSAWATSGTVTLTLTNSSNQAFTYTLPAVSGSDYTYRSMLVPVTNMSATFTATVTGNAKVDDVWLYPDYAQVSSFGYDAETQQKTSETNSNGISTYFDYEGRGRLSHVYDQDKNIVMKKSYVTKESFQSFTTPAISLPNPRNYNNQSMFADTSVNSFVNTLLNADGLQYSWNFGDGTPVTISKEPTGLVAHRYMAPGTYNVSVTKTSPFYGTKSSNRSITVIDSSQVQVPVTIANLTNGTGKITGLDFYKNGVLKYHFDVVLGPDGTPYSIQVPQGKYDLRIYVTGQVYNSSTGKGFRGIDFLLKPTSLGNDQFCANYTGGASIYYPGLELNGRTAMYLTVSTQVCTPTGGVE
ncbi:PKD domain-containing protein [Mucilaginibacter sp. UR6-1]|nr:PKD domain-containing protein [Mucilaginibacter sp. UR6-1]